MVDVWTFFSSKKHFCELRDLEKTEDELNEYT